MKYIKQEKKISFIGNILWLILLILVFGKILKQAMLGESIIINLGFIDIYTFGLKYELTYNSNPNQYIFTIIFSSMVMLYSIYKLYVIIKCMEWNIKFKPIYIFYTVVFLGISFPFWFFILAIISPS